MQNEELNIEPLENALKTLKDGYNLYLNSKKILNDEVLIGLEDSCVKRFEYTYEMSKKIMTRYLKTILDMNIDNLTIVNIFREMYSKKMINNIENWDLYRKQRNSTSHEYDILKSRDCIKIIPDFIDDVEFLVNKLKEKLQ